MASGLIIPGVQVTVVKEVLPQQLAPSGVLGLIGFTERAELTEQNELKVTRAGNWSRYVEVLGRGSAYSLPEARQALDNGVSELVISPLPPNAGATARAVHAGDETKAKAFRDLLTKEVRDATAAADDAKKKWDALKAGTGTDATELKAAEDRYTAAKARQDAATAAQTAGSDISNDKAGVPFAARAPGPWANGLVVRVSYRDNIDQSLSFDVQVLRRVAGREEILEVYRSQALASLTATLRGSSFVKVDETKAVGWPKAGESTLAGGQDASVADYAAALDRLRDEADVDMVLAAVQDFSDLTRVTRIYGAVISHCNALSDECKGRIGFGQVPRTGASDTHAQLASNLVSDRFVLVAPNGVVGAVTGLVGNLPYFHSPTFKRVSGLGDLPPISTEDQKALLRGNVVPVVLERGRGTIVLRGLTTDGDQINVRRVADRAVRMLKMIGDLFIGLLNNADGRTALKQKLVEALVQMEKDGAIVPSTDGKDPAFKVEVYSSQADFALGIVRVNMAVRPVRAIDYIYATITVQV
ncbi:phage tail sheath protein [Pyxidicoccus parkwayensis]|uniref:Phage tail sheath protein n=1 Tax=Pyxidicoccus parkwayensis TaxID=2813578 RepID=A0ABX7NWB1_9BACT|nr:phage tail sheath protein [Pyxidicoccus parkwaysis]QSQ23231.1 phage tail sheath protein [Pyxidicoccus parkwaysis]